MNTTKVSMTPKKVIVIGAGLGGLASAARLAKSGLSVEIFERSSFVGGKCQTEWFGDYAFDTGPTLLTLPAVFKDLFKKTGGRFEREVTLSPVDPAFHYFFADGSSLIFPNLDLPKILHSIDTSFGESAGNDWHNLMQRAEAMWDISRTPFIESEIPSLASFIKNRKILSDIKVIAPWLTLSSLAKKYTSDPRLQMIIERYATYTGSDPRKAPGVLATIAFMETTFGAWHVAGGVGSLATALAKRCEELGVQIHLNTEVEAILTENACATGIQVHGEKIFDDAVIANADAELTYNSLISGENRALRKVRKNLKRSEPSLSGFSLYLGLRNNPTTPTPNIGSHNVYFPERYHDEFEDIFTSHIPVRDPAIYICAPQDPAMVNGSTSEMQAWSVLVNAPRHDPENGFNWHGRGEEYASKLIERLDALGLHVSDRLEVMEFRTPEDFQQRYNAPGGSIYGGAVHGSNSVFRRPRNRTPLTNLYLSSGSAHPGGGLPMVTIGGELVAEAILNSDLGIGAAKNHH